MIDTLRAVQTPEGIELHLPVAGLLPRASAWLIDALIRVGIYIVLGIFSAFFGKAGTGIWFLMTFLIEWFYPVLFEVLRNGQTPGKRTYRIKVIHDDGTPVGWGASLIRNLLRVVDFLPVMYGFATLSMMLSRDFKRLGDLAAGTIVVHEEVPLNTSELPYIPASRPPYPLKLEEQQAIIAFAERRATLTDERAEELASLAAPLVEGAHKPVESLLGMAEWLSGDRRKQK